MKRITLFVSVILISLGIFATDGLLSGSFTVNADGTTVQFSQGNLQYQASTDTWRFAEKQYDVMGDNNYSISPENTNWIDLFGWGTGNHPTEYSTNSNDYPYFYDWGQNPISNGGDLPDQWRVLTNEEWTYIFVSRPNADKLFGLGFIDSGKKDDDGEKIGICGLFILPDDWKVPEGVTFNPSTELGLTYKEASNYYTNWSGSNFSHNTFSYAKWKMMEDSGAVFLPCAGDRRSKSVSSCYNYRHSSAYGAYWEGQVSPSSMRHSVSIGGTDFYYDYKNTGAYCGLSVRLVASTVRFASLYAAIAEADDYYASIVGEYADIAAAFKNAIKEARDTTLNTASSQNAVDAAVVKLNAAKQTAEQAVVLAGLKAAFEAEKDVLKAAADTLLKEGDSEACQQLLANAKSALEALVYDEAKTLDENKAALKAIVLQLAADLLTQRELDRLEAEKNVVRDSLLNVIYEALDYYYGIQSTEAYAEIASALYDAMYAAYLVHENSEVTKEQLEQAITTLLAAWEKAKEDIENLTAIDDVLAVHAPASVQKVMRDGQVLIMRDGKVHNVIGMKVME